MNEKTTQPQPETVGAQARAYEALADLARSFPDLPSAYTIVYRQGSAATLQVNTGADFEAWRTALGVPSANAELKRYSDGTGAFIRIRSEWAGVELDVTTHDVVVPQESQPEDEAPVGLPSEWSAAVSA